MPREARDSRKPGMLTIEGASITYRNFAGEARMYNSAGDRNFVVILDPDTAKMMEKDGWNIRWQPPFEEGDPLRPIIKVNVKYESRDGRKLRPPRVVLITSRGKTNLTEDMIAGLDWADIENVDVIINPYEYNIPGGRSGFSAYLQSLYVTLREDALELKYLDVPDATPRPVRRRSATDAGGQEQEGPPF